MLGDNKGVVSEINKEDIQGVVETIIDSLIKENKIVGADKEEMKSKAVDSILHEKVPTKIADKNIEKAVELTTDYYNKILSYELSRYLVFSYDKYSDCLKTSKLSNDNMYGNPSRSIFEFLDNVSAFNHRFINPNFIYQRCVHDYLKSEYENAKNIAERQKIFLKKEQVLVKEWHDYKLKGTALCFENRKILEKYKSIIDKEISEKDYTFEDVLKEINKLYFSLNIENTQILPLIKSITNNSLDLDFNKLASLDIKGEILRDKENIKNYIGLKRLGKKSYEVKFNDENYNEWDINRNSLSISAKGYLSDDIANLQESINMLYSFNLAVLCEANSNDLKSKKVNDNFRYNLKNELVSIVKLMYIDENQKKEYINNIEKSFNNFEKTNSNYHNEMINCIALINTLVDCRIFMSSSYYNEVEKELTKEIANSFLALNGSAEERYKFSIEKLKSYANEIKKEFNFNSLVTLNNLVSLYQESSQNLVEGFKDFNKFKTENDLIIKNLSTFVLQELNDNSSKTKIGNSPYDLEIIDKVQTLIDRLIIPALSKKDSRTLETSTSFDVLKDIVSNYITSEVNNHARNVQNIVFDAVKSGKNEWIDASFIGDDALETFKDYYTRDKGVIYGGLNGHMNMNGGELAISQQRSSICIVDDSFFCQKTDTIANILSENKNNNDVIVKYILTKLQTNLEKSGLSDYKDRFASTISHVQNDIEISNFVDLIHKPNLDEANNFDQSNKKLIDTLKRFTKELKNEFNEQNVVVDPKIVKDLNTINQILNSIETISYSLGVSKQATKNISLENCKQNAKISISATLNKEMGSVIGATSTAYALRVRKTPSITSKELMINEESNDSPFSTYKSELARFWALAEKNKNDLIDNGNYKSIERQIKNFLRTLNERIVNIVSSSKEGVCIMDDATKQGDYKNLTIMLKKIISDFMKGNYVVSRFKEYDEDKMVKVFMNHICKVSFDCYQENDGRIKRGVIEKTLNEKILTRFEAFYKNELNLQKELEIRQKEDSVNLNKDKTFVNELSTTLNKKDFQTLSNDENQQSLPSQN